MMPVGLYLMRCGRYFLYLCAIPCAILDITFLGLRLVCLQIPFLGSFIRSYVPDNFFFAIYTLGLAIAEPALRYSIKRRVNKGLATDLGYRSRFAEYMLPAKNNVIWIHGMSVGECLSILSLIKHLQQHRSRFNILLTTTITLPSNILDVLPASVLYQLVPMDVPRCVNKFLRHWKPVAIIIVESEIWPNILFQTGNKAKTYLISGRPGRPFYEACYIVDKLSRFTITRRWGIISSFYRVYPWSVAVAKRLKDLGGKESQMIYLDSIKYDAVYDLLEACTVNYADNLMLQGRQVLLMATTHPGEDIISINLHQRLKNLGFSDLLTILAPRHPARIQMEILPLLENNQIPYCLSSAIEANMAPKKPEFVVVDSLGKLMSLYRIATIVVMGGTFKVRAVGGGGHNVLEPLALGKPVITGPHWGIWDEMCTLAQASRVLFKVDDEDMLTSLVKRLLARPSLLNLISGRAKSFVRSRCGSSKRIADTIVNDINHSLHRVR